MAVEVGARVSRGVWVPEAADEIARLAALLRVLPPGSVLSGSTAARMHGMWVPRDGLIDVTVPTGGRQPERVTGPQRTDVRAHRRPLGPGETAVVAGLPVTSVARTWIDLAQLLSLPDLVAAGDSALRGGTDLPDLRGALEAARRRAGVRTARVALPLLNGRSRSRPESHARVAIVRAGLPTPAVNVAIHDEHGGWLAEPDLSYRDARLAIEYQGADHAEPARMRRDYARMMDLKRAGWETFYYTAAQVFTHPELLARDVRAALADRAPQLLTSSESTDDL